MSNGTSPSDCTGPVRAQSRLKTVRTLGYRSMISSALKPATKQTSGVVERRERVEQPVEDAAVLVDVDHRRRRGPAHAATGAEDDDLIGRGPTVCARRIAERLVVHDPAMFFGRGSRGYFSSGVTAAALAAAIALRRLGENTPNTLPKPTLNTITKPAAPAAIADAIMLPEPASR